MENHRGPIVYYVVAILVGFFPWSVFLTPSLTIFVRRWRSTPVGRPALLLLACWAGLWIAFFSLAGTKLPNYVLPAYPALALIVGYFLAAWIRSPQMVTSRLVLPSLVTLAVVGAGLIVGLGVVAMLLLPGDWPIAAVGLAPLVGGVLATLAYRRGKVRRAVVAFGVSAMLLSTLAFAWVAPRVSRHQNASPLVAAAHAAQGPDTRLATYDLWLPSVVFYAQAPVARLADANHVQAYFADHPQGCLLTRPEHFAKLAGSLSAEIVVLARQRRFLRRGEVLLVGRRGADVVAHEPAAGQRR